MANQIGFCLAAHKGDIFESNFFRCGAFRPVVTEIKARKRELGGVNCTDYWINLSRSDTLGSVRAQVGCQCRHDKPMVEVPICDTATVDNAVAAAWDAYEREWTDTTPTDRSHRLFE